MKIFILIVIAVVVVVGAYFIFAKSSNNNSGNTAQNMPSPTPTPTAPTTLPDVVKVTMTTAKGEIDMELYTKVAPKTVTNFVKLAQSGYYDGIKFHRVVPDFVIQTGDPLSRTDDPRVGTGGPGYTFEDEINPKAQGLSDDVIKQYEAEGYTYDFSLPSLPVTVGSVAMANAGPNTNGSQFFIVTTKDQPMLNGKYTVFGKVTKGMDVVLKIQQGDLLKRVKVD